MELSRFVLIAAGVTLLALVVAYLLRPRAPALDLDPADERELRQLGLTVLAEHQSRRAGLIIARLQTVIGRGVPASSVQPTGTPGQWVMTFADGSRVVVHELHSGDLLGLGFRLTRQRVRAVSYDVVGGDIVVTVAWGRKRLTLRAVDAPA